jgi:hypothetical protein
MNLPSRTSKLLELQQAAEAELNVRFSKIFKKHRRLAFVHRQDHLFTEHWTPELAATGYDFIGYELHGEHVVLHGQEQSSGFTYRISISFPQDLADKPQAIDAYFKRQFTEAQASQKKNPSTAVSASRASAGIGR